MPSEGVKKHILIVDDDEGIRQVLTESLHLIGYETHAYPSAEAALKELDTLPVKLAVLDINLPGINGLQLCRQLRAQEKHRDLPIIMMTAFYKEAEHIREAREDYGATEYLLKPFPLNSLHKKIAEIIGTGQSDNQAGKISVKGTLTRSPLPNILHNLYALQATGLLHLENKEIKKIVYIRNGYPIFVRSNVVKEFLGQILLRKGYLNDVELEQSLACAKEKGQKHGMALIEMGLLTPRELDKVLQDQVLDKLLDAFAWTSGNYQFVQAREFKQNVTSIDLSPSNLILQGLREYAPKSVTHGIVETYLDKYLHYADNPLYRFQEINLTAAEQQLLDKYNGDITLGDFLQKHTLSKNTIQPLFAALLTTGVLIPSHEPQPEERHSTNDDSQPDGTDGEAVQRAAFLKEYAWMMEQDYFSLLGVEETDGAANVRKAYYRLVKKYHPDRFFEQELLLDLKDKVHTLFQRITQANETLTDRESKARYINELNGLAAVPGTTLESILEAEKEFHRGQVLLRVGKFVEASNTFANAIALNPNEGEYLVYQSWANFKADPDSQEVCNNARTTIAKVIEKTPKLSKAHLFLGYICKQLGNHSEAGRHFEKAIQLDPNSTQALREVRLMSLRKEQTGKRKGLFGKKS